MTRFCLEWGKLHLGDVSPQLIEAYMRKRQKEKVPRTNKVITPRTVNLEVQVLGRVFNKAIDWLYNGSAWRAYTAPRINTPNNHGTGCTLATAIAAFLAQGQTLEDAVQHAKDYLTAALQKSLDLGKGAGPLDHGWQHGDVPDDTTP